MMPVWTQSMVGASPDTPAFRERVQEFLRELAQQLAEPPAAGPPE
jgi:hypothetical protein